MADQDRFEDRLAMALDRYADEAPERNRLDELADWVSARPQRHGLFARLATAGSVPARRLGATRSAALSLAWLLLLVALVATLLASVAMIGGLLRSNELSVVPTSSPGPTSSDKLPRTDSTLAWEEVPLPADRGTRGPYPLDVSLGYPLVYDGDQFLTYSPDGRRISRSADGLRWETYTDSVPGPTLVAASHGTILAWDGPSVHLLRPDGSSSAREFGEADSWVSGGTVGPSGIVVLLSSDSGFDGGWFSENGETWTPIADPPDSPGTWQAMPVAATPDGFFGRTPDGSVWRSEDGLAWTVIGSSTSKWFCQAESNVLWGSCYQELVPWRDGVVIANGSVPRYEYWTADGLEVLATGVPEGGVTGAGPLGILTVDRDANLVDFSLDGEVWAESPLPAGHTWSDNMMGHYPSVAVGQDSVLVVLWEQAVPGDASTDVPSLWRVTPK